MKTSPCPLPFPRGTSREQTYFPALRSVPAQDDFYLHLLSWSASNLLAVALQNNVYIWNAETGLPSGRCGMGLSQREAGGWG